MSCSANNKKKKPDETSIKFKLMGRQVELLIQNNTAIKAGRGRRLLSRSHTDRHEDKNQGLEPSMKPAKQETYT